MRSAGQHCLAAIGFYRDCASLMRSAFGRSFYTTTWKQFVDRSIELLKESQAAEYQ
jgi:hypothetical protein